MLTFKTVFTAIALSTLPLSMAAADPIQLGDLILEKAWTRATPPRARAGGGFLTITNTGNQDARLIAGQSDVAERTEIHEMAVTDGIMKMRELTDGLTIPAGETVELKPGGYHVMFMGLKDPFVAGESVSVTLTFEPGGPVDVTMPVHEMGAKSTMSHSKH